MERARGAMQPTRVCVRTPPQGFLDSARPGVLSDPAMGVESRIQDHNVPSNRSHRLANGEADYAANGGQTPFASRSPHRRRTAAPPMRQSHSPSDRVAPAHTHPGLGAVLRRSVGWGFRPGRSDAAAHAGGWDSRCGTRADEEAAGPCVVVPMWRTSRHTATATLTSFPRPPGFAPPIRTVVARPAAPEAVAWGWSGWV